MLSKRAADALADILRNIDLARSFTARMDFDAFCADVRTVYAVTRCFEIISEASRRLPESLKSRHPTIPWADIAGAGNVYRHDYEDLVERQLWHTLRHDLEPLRQVMLRELAAEAGGGT
ncbi:MAG: DUF86 domain-containing protein [Betaproteobacteria bacterium]|nr:DUF86 domain-containing protein [Betaproteobacteria bacterium]